MFEKILVPVDGSEHSDRALARAIEVAKRFGSELTIMHVYSVYVQPVMVPEPTTPGSPGVPILTSQEVDRVVEAARQAAKRILRDAEEKASSETVPVKKLLVEGHAVQEIVRAAEKESYDLIVIGARGISHIREMFLGSVTDGVIHHATCPVLVVK